MAVLLLLGLAACGGKREGPAATSASPTAAPPAVTPTPGPLIVANFKFGRLLGPDGTAANEGGTFIPGEPIFVTLEVKNAPPGATVRIVATTMPDKKKVAEEQKPPSGEKGALVFQFGDTKGWAPGDYRLEMHLVDGSTTTQLGTYDFKVGPPPRRAR